MMKKHLTLLIAITIVAGSHLSYLSTADTNSLNILSLKTPESHLIEGVSYVRQTEGYFCYYASCAMIFNHLGLNTSLEEILFYDGVGYSHKYNEDDRLPDEGRYLGDFNFVLDLFGLVEESWMAPFGEQGNDEYWELYLQRLKEDISNDIPVMTLVDPFSLSSLKNQFIIPDFLWEKLLPPGIHMIIIIGYDENNQSICYNDPNAGFYGESSYGDHAWMNVNDYRKAVERNIYNAYVIWTYNQIQEPLPKKEAFEKAYIKNIEKIKGNRSAFFENGHGGFQDVFGINASKQLVNDFSSGEENRMNTIQLYKNHEETGINYSLSWFMEMVFSYLFPNHPSIFDIFMVGNIDPYESIAAEKIHCAKYLEHNIFYTELGKKQASLLTEESDIWVTLSNYYKVFMRRGNYLSSFRAENLIEKMEKTMQNIVTLEQSIIDESDIDY